MPDAQPTTLQQWLDWAHEHFPAHALYYGHGTDNAEDEAIYLMRYALQCDFDFSGYDPQQALSDAQNAAIRKLFEQRIETRKPAAYLVREAWFAGYPFYVDERVLVPRSPLAELIAEHFTPWIDPARVHRILDLGTGSGCIAIACALYFEEASVDAVDIEDVALQVAQINIARHRLQARVHLHKSDMFDDLPAARYDIIMSNPPYVSLEEMQVLPDEYRHEPVSGLAAGADGLDCVRKILARAAEFLQPDGILIVEVGNSQHAVEQAWPQVPFTWLEFEYGGEGVFLLDAEQLAKYQQDFAR